MTRWLRTAGLAAIASVGLAQVGAAGDLVFPLAWEGVWDYEEITRVCGESGGTPEPGTDDFCEGESILGGDGDGMECSGTVTDTEIHITCVSETPIEGLPGCTTLVTTLTIDAVRSGDTATGGSTFTFDYNDGCSIPDSCTETVSTLTRTGADPDCSSPVESATWAKIKSVYR